MVRRNKSRMDTTLAFLIAFTMVGSLVPVVRSDPDDKKQNAAKKSEPKRRKVKAYVQPRPGKPREEIEMTVHPVPVDLPIVEAGEAPLEDNDLVLGVVIDEQAMAYPIRFLSMFEVVNSRVGDVPVAPSW